MGGEFRHLDGLLMVQEHFWVNLTSAASNVGDGCPAVAVPVGISVAVPVGVLSFIASYSAVEPPPLHAVDRASALAAIVKETLRLLLMIASLSRFRADCRLFADSLGVHPRCFAESRKGFLERTIAS
ncbi:hypothetical protein ACFQYP_41085 [Nonomuraea antimicrobica]